MMIFLDAIFGAGCLCLALITRQIIQALRGDRPVPGNPPCRCGHTQRAHLHLRKGSECVTVLCGCRRYRKDRKAQARALGPRALPRRRPVPGLPVDGRPLDGDELDRFTRAVAAYNSPATGTGR